MSKPKKLPSGSWNIRIYIGTDPSGKKQFKSITAPTKAEVEYEAAQYKTKVKPDTAYGSLKTVRETIQEYIELSHSSLSATTLNSYDIILRFAFQDIMDIQVNKLSDTDMQRAINKESTRGKSTSNKGKTISAKTVKNEWGLIAAAIYSIYGVRYKVKLPRTQKHLKDYPEPKTVFDAVKGTDIELPCLLAMWLSFTASEIRGLRFSDIQNGHITINRVMVDVKNEAVVKDNAKQELRLRRLDIPDYIMDLIKKDELYQEYLKGGPDDYIVRLTHSQLYERWRTARRGKGMDKITFHDLRHINASVMVMLNIPDKYALERGGWKTDTTYKRIYQETFSSERKNVDQQINNYFENVISDKKQPRTTVKMTRKIRRISSGVETKVETTPSEPLQLLRS